MFVDISILINHPLNLAFNTCDLNFNCMNEHVIPNIKIITSHPVNNCSRIGSVKSFDATVPLKCKLPPSRETRLASLETRLVSLATSLVSLETRLVSFESFLVSHECTASTNALHCGNTQSQRSNTVK